MQWILCGFGAGVSLLILLLLPETAHQTGLAISMKENQQLSNKSRLDRLRSAIYFPNPFGTLALLLKPTVLVAVSLALAYRDYQCG